MTFHIAHAESTLLSPFLESLKSYRPVLPCLFQVFPDTLNYYVCQHGMAEAGCSRISSELHIFLLTLVSLQHIWCFLCVCFNGSGLFFSSSHLTEQSFMLDFDYLIDPPAAFIPLFSSLTSSTSSKQKNLSPLEKELFGQILNHCGIVSWNIYCTHTRTKQHSAKSPRTRIAVCALTGALFPASWHMASCYRDSPTHTMCD